MARFKVLQTGFGASGCLYYGFAVCGSTVYCREGYKDAEAALLHGADVKDMLAQPLMVRKYYKVYKIIV